jgi:hypothetical protein
MKLWWELGGNEKQRFILTLSLGGWAMRKDRKQVAFPLRSLQQATLGQGIAI